MAAGRLYVTCALDAAIVSSPEPGLAADTLPAVTPTAASAPSATIPRFIATSLPLPVSYKRAGHPQVGCWRRNAKASVRSRRDALGSPPGSDGRAAPAGGRERADPRGRQRA